MPRKTKPVLVQGEESFGQRLARLRREAGFSQRELGEQVGLSQRMVAYYEGQTDHPPAALLPSLAELLGVSTDQLLGTKPVKKAAGPANQRLWRRFKQIEKLPAQERRQLLGVIDAVLDRHRLTHKDAG